MYRDTSPWTPQKKRQLAALWEQGKPGSEIAVIMGIPRNAVMGAAYRMQLPKRLSPYKYVRRQKNPVDAAPAKDASAKNFSPPHKNSISNGYLGDDAIFGGQGISLLEAVAFQCRWPLDGKAKDGNPRCCGAPSCDGIPYCAHHARIAFQNMAGAREAA